MRDHNLDSQSFCSELERLCQSAVSQVKFLRSSVSDTSKCLTYFRFENSFRIKSSSTRILTILSILVWFFPEEFQVLLVMDLQEKWKDKDDSILGELLLRSKGHCLNFLLETSLWHTRDFFGNVITRDNLELALSKVVPALSTRKKPRRVQRHRGYRDKGTLKLQHEIHDCSDLTSEQNEIEEQRCTTQDSINFMIGWFT